MTESLKRRVHDDIVRRWVHVRTPGHESYGKPDYDDSHIQSIKIGWTRFSGHGDQLQSYGPHFPLVECIRDRKRKSAPTRLWLLNGDVWGGSSGFGMSTSSQQSQVRNLVNQTDIPWIILPFSAIDGASIIHDSITLLTQDEESWEQYTHTQAEQPTGAHWNPIHELVEGTGYGPLENGSYGHVHYASMADIPAEILAYFDADGNVLPEFEEHVQHGVAFGRKYRKWGSPNRNYATGAIRRQGSRTYQPMEGDGPLYVPPVYRLTGRTLHDSNGMWTKTESGAWTQERTRHTLGQSVFRAAYRGDNGKRYWANFLSGIDNSPTGSGYFLVQLPKGADVSSVQAAIESLKPASVRAAESIGLEVKRQGDLFAIPTQFDTRKLRKLGADIRESRKAVHTERELYGTRHVGRDIAILPNGVTLARGTIRHAGGQHSYLSLGNVWHIVARNTVPLAR